MALGVILVLNGIFICNSSAPHLLAPGQWLLLCRGRAARPFPFVTATTKLRGVAGMNSPGPCCRRTPRRRILPLSWPSRAGEKLGTICARDSNSVLPVHNYVVLMNLFHLVSPRLPGLRWRHLSFDRRGTGCGDAVVGLGFHEH